MFGYDRVNERYLLENTNRFDIPEWKRATAEHMENNGFMSQIKKFFRSAL